MPHLVIRRIGKTLMKIGGMPDYQCTNIDWLISAGKHEWNIKTDNGDNSNIFVGVCRQDQLHKK
jgi:hypothetical protein